LGTLASGAPAPAACPSCRCCRSITPLAHTCPRSACT
jgi:hypothetical protein